jgi:hypothetical protein
MYYSDERDQTITEIGIVVFEFYYYNNFNYIHKHFTHKHILYICI